MTINVTACAQAGIDKKIKPQFLTGLYYMMGQDRVDLPSGDFVDDATAAQLAQLLGGTVVQLKPRATWDSGQVNATELQDLPLQNFVAFADQPDAQPAGALLVVNCGDLANLANQAFNIDNVPQALATEQALAYLIHGATMSQAAQNALASSPIANWPPQPVYWYTA